MDSRDEMETVTRSPLANFVRARIGLLSHCLAEHSLGAQRPMTDRQRQAKYSFVHGFFYPCEFWLPKRLQPLASKRAVVLAESAGLTGAISSYRRTDVARATRVAPGRNPLYYEHVYSGQMCWNAIAAMSHNNQLKVEQICSLLLHNYRVAWIARDEARIVGRGKRGSSLVTAIKHFTRMGVDLYDGDELIDYAEPDSYCTSTREINEFNFAINRLVVRLGFVVAGSDNVDAAERQALYSYATRRSDLTLIDVKLEETRALGGLAALNEQDWATLKDLGTHRLNRLMNEIRSASRADGEFDDTELNTWITAGARLGLTLEA